MDESISLVAHKLSQSLEELVVHLKLHSELQAFSLSALFRQTWSYADSLLIVYAVW